MITGQPFQPQCWPVWRQHLPTLSGLALVRVALPSLAELEEATVEWLAAEEQRRFAGFALEKRRRQWLGGRLAAKLAAAHFWGGQEREWRKIAVVAAPGGAPCLVAPDCPPRPWLSISHSGDCAAAMAADLPCGLDVQQVVPRILAVRKRFVLAGEEDVLWSGLPAATGEGPALTMLWAGKEAVRKMAWPPPLPFFSEISLVAAAGGDGCGSVLFSFVVAPVGSRPKAVIRILALLDNEMAWAFGGRPEHKKGKEPWSS